MRTHPDWHVLDENGEAYISAPTIRQAAAMNGITSQRQAERDAAEMNESAGEVAYHAAAVEDEVGTPAHRQPTVVPPPLDSELTAQADAFERVWRLRREGSPMALVFLHAESLELLSAAGQLHVLEDIGIPSIVCDMPKTLVVNEFIGDRRIFGGDIMLGDVTSIASRRPELENGRCFAVIDFDDIVLSANNHVQRGLPLVVVVDKLGYPPAPRPSYCEVTVAGLLAGLTRIDMARPASVHLAELARHARADAADVVVQTPAEPVASQPAASENHRMVGVPHEFIIDCLRAGWTTDAIYAAREMPPGAVEIAIRRAEHLGVEWRPLLWLATDDGRQAFGKLVAGGGDGRWGAIGRAVGQVLIDAERAGRPKC